MRLVIKKFAGAFFTFFLILLQSCSQKSNEISQEQRDIYKDSLFREVVKIRNIDTLFARLDDFVKKNDKIGEMFCYREIGRQQREKSQLLEAIQNHQTALDIAIQLKDTTEIVKVLNDLGVDFRRIGALPEASSYHYKALNYADAYSGKKNKIDAKNLVVATNGIANVSLLLGYLDEAEKYYRISLEGEKELNSEVGQAINLAKLGTIFEQRQQYDSAQAYYLKSMEQNQLAKTNRGIALCLIHLGNLYKTQKKYDPALEKYKEAFNILQNEPTNKWDWLKSCIAIAEIQMYKGNTEQYQHYINLAEKASNEINSLESIIAVHSIKYEFYNLHKNYAEALNHYKQSQILKDSLQGIEKNNRYTDLRLNYEREQSDRRLQQVELQNKLDHDKRQRTFYIILAALSVSLMFVAILYYAFLQRVRSNRILKQIEKNRSDFFTNITHELRTPLTVIQGLNRQMQQNPKLTQKEKNVFMKAIDRQSNNLLNLVNQLLDFARLKADVDTPQWRNGDIIPYLRMLAETFLLYAQEKNINLVFYSEVTHQKMDFIPSYVDKIVGNLLSNAIKYSSPNSTIHFVVSKEITNTICLRVSDNGQGIAPEDIKHIFELFYQGQQTQKISGTGVGLSFTQMLVKKMNGTISVKSELNKGSEFSVTLPIKNKTLSYIAPLEIESKTITENREQTVTDKDIPLTENSNKPIILLVEDNPDILMYVKSLLKNSYQIITAQDGEEGLEKAKKHIPDLVITDVMMPKKDGFEFCQEMKQSELLSHIPVIMLTAKITDQDRLEGLRHGVEAYIRKPFQAEELLIRIQNILENRQLLKQKYIGAAAHNSHEKNGLDDDNLAFLQKINTIIYSDLSNSNINASFLANKMSMSVSQLSRKLVGITGHSTVSYITQVRLGYAKKMLNSGTMTITEIADSCGFIDSNYFSRAFKKEFGATPSQYKKES